MARRLVLLIAAGVATLLAAWPASRLRLNESIETMYAPDNPHLQAYLRSKRLFGGDEFVIVAYRDPHLFAEPNQLSEQARQDLQEFSEKLSAVPGVRPKATQHLADALKFPWGRSRTVQFLEGMLVGSDRQTTAVVLRLQKTDDAPVPRPTTFARIRELARSHDPPACVVGEPMQVNDMFRCVEDDGRTLGLASSGLLMLVIFVLFRNLRWMILPLAVVQVTLIWTRAALVVSRMELSMVSSMLSSLVTIIGIATAMHITVRFRELRREMDRMDRADALRQTLHELIGPIFWTCATTAAGFGVLLSSSIQPVRSFGVMIGLATMLVLVAVATLLPGGILLGRRQSDPGQAPAEGKLVRLLGRLNDLVRRHPLAFGLASLLLFGFTTAGLFRLRIETDFSRNFRAESPIVQSLDFVETHLGGAGNWEVNFPAPEPLTAEFFDQVRALCEELRTLRRDDESKLTKVVSLSDGLDFVPTRLLFSTLSLDRRLGMLDAVQPEFIPTVYNAEQGRMRIILRARERQPSEAKLALIAEVERTARKYFPDAEATGLFVLLAHLVMSLMDDQLVSFALATVSILLLMTVAFRSFRIGLISLVPNIFPIVLVIGSMGWLDVPVNIGTAMIASVSMGLTVDSSIHYLTGYQRARRRGLDLHAALRETSQGVGLPLVFANVALVIGFSVLTLSHFIPLIHFGVLVSAAMLGGLIGNLILLPLLLRWSGR